MAPDDPEDESAPEGDDRSLVEPLALITAQTLARSILASGTHVFSTHVITRLQERGMTQLDVINTLRAGRCVLVNFENSSYRYQFETGRGYHAVVTFRSKAEMVTAWK